MFYPPLGPRVSAYWGFTTCSLSVLSRCSSFISLTHNLWMCLDTCFVVFSFCLQTDHHGGSLYSRAHWRPVKEHPDAGLGETYSALHKSSNLVHCKGESFFFCKSMQGWVVFLQKYKSGQTATVSHFSAKCVSTSHFSGSYRVWINFWL